MTSVISRPVPARPVPATTLLKAPVPQENHMVNTIHTSESILDSGSSHYARRLAQLDSAKGLDNEDSLIMDSMDPRHYPEKVDWVAAGVVTPVRNQGLTCGESQAAVCASHSATLSSRLWSKHFGFILITSADCLLC